jgi:hypothetical protein
MTGVARAFDDLDCEAEGCEDELLLGELGFAQLLR